MSQGFMITWWWWRVGLWGRKGVIDAGGEGNPLGVKEAAVCCGVSHCWEKKSLGNVEGH